MAPETRIDQKDPFDYKWDELYHSPEYRTLVKTKRKFIISCLTFFTIFYVSLLILQGYFPHIASRPLIGTLNIGYLYALIQIPVAWLLCLAYVWYSRKTLDPLKEKVIKRMKIK